MKKQNLIYVLKVVFLILLFSFILDKIVFFSLNKISDRVYTGQSIGKLNQFLNIKDTTKLLIFGSSRANHEIDPTLLTNSGFNMGVDGRAIAYNATLIKLLPKLKKQIILLHIDPENAFKKNYKGKDLDALIIKYNRNKIIRNEIDKLKQDNIFQKFYWSLCYNGKLLGILRNYLFPKYNYKKYFGYDPIFPTEIQKKIFYNKLKKKRKIICKENFKINKIYNDYLNEIKEFCKKNNKELIIFTSPVYNDRCKTDNKIFNEIMKQKKIKYFDFTDFFKNNNKLEYWKDEEHLSNKGAVLFTNKLKRIIEFYTCKL